MILEQELKGKTLSPQEVRSILKTDNKEIVELCKRASILPRKNSKTDTKQPSAMLSILNSLKDMENKLSNRIAKVIDEKLEGMDEVVVELIRCKTDNETLRQKIIDLNKEIYQLKNDLHSYKPVGLGFYKKKEKHVWE